MPIARLSGAERPHHEEPLDLVGAHRAVLVAGQPRDLGILVPAQEVGAGCHASGVGARPATRRCGPETSAGGASASTLYHRPHAPLERGRRTPSPPRRRRPRRRRSSPTYLASLDADGAARRRRVPHRPAVPRGGPADDRHRLGRDPGAVLRVAGADARRARPGLRPVRPTSRRRSTDVLDGGRPRARPRRREPTVAEVRAAFEAIQRGVRARPRRPRCSRRCSRRSAPADGRRDRQGAQRASSGSASARGCSRRRSRRRSTGRSTP